jgi:hypothetical protein
MLGGYTARRTAFAYVVEGLTCEVWLCVQVWGVLERQAGAMLL